METYMNYINGKLVAAASGDICDIINPATQEVIAQIASSGIDDVEAAVDAAYNSFYETREWRGMSAPDRADILFKIADKIEENIDMLAHLESTNQGKPLREAEGDVSDAAHYFRYYAGLITKPDGHVYSVGDGFGQMHAYNKKEPIGVCALITPWNYPLLMAAQKVAPALAAGCSIIIKPPTVTPLTTIKMVEFISECGVPAGACNLLLGPGGLIGDALSAHKKVDCLTFTGSTPVGQAIMRNAAGNVKKIGLELGGKSPGIVFEDADIKRTVEWCMLGVFFNQGEVCSATSRLYVHEGVYDEFVEEIVKKTKAMTIGNPLDNPDIGAIVSKAQFDTVMKYIELGKQEGATCLCGGEACTEGECAKGFFIKPTIFVDCNDTMRICREEIFGPVLTIQKFSDEDDVIRRANDSDYGLAAAVFTKDHMRAIRVTNELRAGNCWINCNQPAFIEAPWGGYKMSGIGRDLGVEGLEEYQEVKSVIDSLEPGLLGWYEH